MRPDDSASGPSGSASASPSGGRGHKFIFRYDFGDDPRFQVMVADIHEHRSPRAKSPRVVARTGKAPEQYPRYD